MRASHQSHPTSSGIGIPSRSRDYPTRSFDMPPSWLLRRLSTEQPGETKYVHACMTRPRCDYTHRKKERTTAFVVSAVLHGFRAIDTGTLHGYPTFGCKSCSSLASQIQQHASPSTTGKSSTPPWLATELLVYLLTVCKGGSRRRSTPDPLR